MSEHYYYAVSLSLLLVAWFFISLVRVTLYEHQIKKIHKKIEKGIAEIKTRPGLASITEGQIRALENSYATELKMLEMKRRFILDKLPFLTR